MPWKLAAEHTGLFVTISGAMLGIAVMWGGLVVRIMRLLKDQDKLEEKQDKLKDEFITEKMHAQICKATMAELRLGIKEDLTAMKFEIINAVKSNGRH